MKIILVSGKAESGKDTACEFILKQRKGKRVGLADSLKNIAKEYFGWSGVKDEEGRSLLQKLGDTGRAINPFFWLEIVGSVLKLFEEMGEEIVIIPDLRFQNELSWFCFQMPPDDFITLRIERPGHENALTEEQRNHISEIDLDGAEFDYVISATTISELEEKVNEFLKVV